MKCSECIELAEYWQSQGEANFWRRAVCAKHMFERVRQAHKEGRDVEFRVIQAKREK